MPYVERNRDRTGSTSAKSILRALSGPSSRNRDRMITTDPASSRPRRPARPAICRSDAVVKGTIMPLSPLFERAVMTVVRAGRFTPAASVSVAKQHRTKPARKSSSMSALCCGSRPAWCAATPLSSSARRRCSDTKAAACGFASRHRATRKRTSTFCASVSSATDARPSSSADASQPLREKAKKMAGNMSRFFSSRAREGADIGPLSTTASARLRPASFEAAPRPFSRFLRANSLSPGPFCKLARSKSGLSMSLLRARARVPPDCGDASLARSRASASDPGPTSAERKSGLTPVAASA
mmetsp:Transcript_32386/g.109128  ORF Transcript_32386/g.109128 Transcript_32386/m.109128 type:complete len:298 (+) Transcript_32386:1216-2109(+)